MEKKKSVFSENILLLIIAVTLLGVKISDATMLLTHQSEKKISEQITTTKPVVPSDKKVGDKATKNTAKKAEFTFTLSDLNRFTADEMLQLDGVGPVLAARIIVYRKQHGGIKEISDLKHVKGIGVKKYAIIMKQYR